MDNRIQIIRKKDFTSKDKRSDDLQMLFKRGDIEVMKQFISCNASVWIEPAASITTIEFFYLLSGKIEIVQDDEVIPLSAGDSFLVENISKTYLMKVIEDSEVLYFSNSPIYENLVDFTDKIDAIMNTITEKDRYTKNHCEHVQHICDELYHKLPNKNEMNYEQLILAAFFLDVGKAYVPDDLLNYLEKYNEEQYKIMQKHIHDGYAIVQPLYGEDMAKMILTHHERIDGSGYLGLRGNEISFEARILAVADSFDAMISPRKYKKKYSCLEAAQELVRLNDKYDILITKCLLELVQDKVLDESNPKLAFK